MKISSWRFGISLLLICASVSVSARAQKQVETCSWLNAATASGVLGGDAELSITHSATDHADQPNNAPGDATCEFKLMHAAASLKISVHTMQAHAKEFPAYVATCGGSPRKLIGVGNEAVACTLPNSAAGTTEQVVARIRQRVFILSWLMPAGEASSKEVIRDKLQNTAEQIAGSLF